MKKFRYFRMFILQLGNVESPAVTVIILVMNSAKRLQIMNDAFSEKNLIHIFFP